MKQIEVVGISRPVVRLSSPGHQPQAPVVVVVVPARYQIRLRQPGRYKSGQQLVGEPQCVWYRVVANREMLMQGWSSSERSSPHSAPTPPPPPLRPITTAIPSSQQDPPRSRGTSSHHHIPHSAIPFAIPFPLPSSPDFYSLVKRMESRHHDTTTQRNTAPPPPLAPLPLG